MTVLLRQQIKIFKGLVNFVTGVILFLLLAAVIFAVASLPAKLLSCFIPLSPEAQAFGSFLGLIWLALSCIVFGEGSTKKINEEVERLNLIQEQKASRGSLTKATPGIEGALTREGSS